MENLPKGMTLDPVEMRRAFDIITGKWKLEILWLLFQRTYRFGELRKALPGITQHMLTAQLRALEADGLVSRTIHAEVPPRVDYAMMPAARGLAPIIGQLLIWWHGFGQSRLAEASGGARRQARQRKPRATGAKARSRA